MNNIKISGISLKCLLAVGLLTACNNDEAITPTSTTGTYINNNNAKLSPLTRLTNDNGRSIQYVKSGKFFGKVSRVNEAPWSGYYLTYAYDDSNPSELWITRKMYKSSTNSFIKEERYKVINGLCTRHEDDFGVIHTYAYTPQGYLDEVIYTVSGQLKESWKYVYSYTGAGQTYRLNKIERKDAGTPWINYHFTYKQVQDKYPLNNPLNSEDGNVDKYLPFFGKGGDLLIESIVEENLLKNTSVQTFYTGHIVDSDGLVTSREMVKYATVYLETFKYSSTTWQGL